VSLPWSVSTRAVFAGSSSSASVNSDGSRGKGEDGVTLTCGTSQFFNLNQKSNLQRIDSFQTC
jgi:hypothetical protein